MAVSERESAGSGRLKFCLSLEARDHRGRNVRKRAHFLGHQGHVRTDGLCSDYIRRSIRAHLTQFLHILYLDLARGSPRVARAGFTIELASITRAAVSIRLSWKPDAVD
jgi:hypothetical protein